MPLPSTQELLPSAERGVNMKRMSCLMVVIGGILLLSLSSAQAAVIYNTFGLGDSYLTDYGSGFNISGPTSGVPNGYGGEGEVVQGNGFVPAYTGTLDSVELAMGLVSGANELEVWLMGANFSVPGSVIETFSFSGQMQDSSGGGGIITGYSVEHPVLNANELYWLVASAPGDAHATWYTSQDRVQALTGIRNPEGLWELAFDGPQTAFRISGTLAPVPIPSTLLLMGSGLAGVVGIARRRMRK